MAGKNFGCGSSREHAVWALEDFGFRAVIAPSFADIFANNCVKNGVLTVVLPKKKSRKSSAKPARYPTTSSRSIWSNATSRMSSGFSASFQIDEFTRHCLLEGLDDIGLTLQHEPEITAYESRHPAAQKIV